MALSNSTGLLDKLGGIKTTLITNGQFTSATTGWTATDSTLASTAGGQSGNCLTITETGSANPGKAYQDITTEVGRTYRLEFYFKKGTSVSGSVTVGTTGDDDGILISPSYSDADWDLKELSFVATATTTRIVLLTDDATAGETSLFDEVTCYASYNGFQDIMKGCFANVYTSPRPTNADSAATGTLLVTLSLDGGGTTGFTWADAVSGVSARTSTETVSGVAVASGTAAWVRVYEPTDTPANASTTKARFDGEVLTSGGVFTMANLTVTLDATQTASTSDFSYQQT